MLLGKILKDLWILTSTGVVLYSRVIDETIDPQLFGALMSALNTFAERLSDGGISNFELNNLRFVVLRRKYFLFIGSTANKTKEKTTLEELKVISEKFLNVYSQDILSNWNNDISLFRDFGKYIKKSLKKA
ncbi:MAG: hypothetical protein EU533_04055 [Promethearchaeota archaeon]|nr:MAG: hypothetical protein EU533_04055 [Candidatus Lokiarchaeota archaeon]